MQNQFLSQMMLSCETRKLLVTTKLQLNVSNVSRNGDGNYFQTLVSIGKSAMTRISHSANEIKLKCTL